MKKSSNLEAWTNILIVAFLSSLMAAKNAGWCRRRAGETEPEFTHRRILSKMCVAAQSNLAKFLGRAIKGLPPFASYQCVPGSRRFTNRSTVQRAAAAHVCSLFPSVRNEESRPATVSLSSIVRRQKHARDERKTEFRGNRTIIMNDQAIAWIFNRFFIDF